MERMPQTSGFEEERDRTARKMDYSPCAVCGHAVKDATHEQWVRVAFLGEECAPYAITDAEAEYLEDEDQGCWAIGKGCLAHHPQLAPYVRKTPRT